LSLANHAFVASAKELGNFVITVESLGGINEFAVTRSSGSQGLANAGKGCIVVKPDSQRFAIAVSFDNSDAMQGNCRGETSKCYRHRPFQSVWLRKHKGQSVDATQGSRGRIFISQQFLHQFIRVDRHRWNLDMKNKLRCHSSFAGASQRELRLVY